MSEQNCDREAEPLPVAKSEDVEYAAELADEDDIEAAERAEEADFRQEEEQQETR